jgi:lipoprotein signal peptidase
MGEARRDRSSERVHPDQRALPERRLGPVRTGIFNVADVAIMLGAAVMLIAEIRTARRPT